MIEMRFSTPHDSLYNHDMVKPVFRYSLLLDRAVFMIHFFRSFRTR